MNTQNKNKNKTVKRRNVTNKTVKNNSNTEVQTLRNTYGYITIPKGMSFYHARDTPYDTANPDFMLFLTFDIDDWNNSEDKYVTKFVVKKEFDILFMVNSIDTTYGGKLFSLLHILLNRSIAHNLNKQYEPNLPCYFPYIVKENLAGWFCSVENRTGIEIAIYNSNKYLEAIETVKVIDILTKRKDKFGCRYVLYNNVRNIYKIHSDNYITIYINQKYEEQIDNFKNKSIKNNYDYALQKLFKNAKIIYFKSKYTKNMFWNC